MVVKTLKSLLLCLTVVLMVSSSALAAPLSQPPTIILYVRQGATGDCLTWATACDLQTAMQKNIANQIWVAAGTYKPTTGTDRAATFNLISGVWIFGGFPAEGSPTWEDRDWELNPTILSGDLNGDDGQDFSNYSDNSINVVMANNVNYTARLDGFTITGGNASDSYYGDRIKGGGGLNNQKGSPQLANLRFLANLSACNGGGMTNNAGSPTLFEVTFLGNAGDKGGGMYSVGSPAIAKPVLTNVSFELNTANYGGGMYNEYNSSPTLTNVTFSGNTTADKYGRGAGMHNFSNSNAVLDHVTFTGNISLGWAGGMYNDTSQPILTDVSFIDNSAVYGGGGMGNVSWSYPLLTNVTFTHNQAREGGGMYNESSSPSLTNITFSENSAYYEGTEYDMAGRGGGMHNTYFSDPTLTNVTFYKNTANISGGGMHNEYGSSPTLNDVTFSENTSVDGGGVSNMTRYTRSSSPNFTNVTFYKNSATRYGGGMYSLGIIGYPSNPTLSSVTFSENSAGNSGGGMYNSDSTNPTLSDVTFYKNTAGNGGGVYNFGTVESPTIPVFTNVLFNNNYALNWGGGMHNTYSSPSLTNVTFSNNTALNFGGGMVNATSSPTLTNVTFVANTSTYSGGGIYNYSTSAPTIANSILWGNTPDQISHETGSTAAITYSDIQGGCPTDTTCTNIIDMEPLLGPLADNGGLTLTHALGPGSPAIDAGDPANCPDTDQRGFPRPVDGDKDGSAVCDMGAYEYQFNSRIYLPLIIR
jgi:predicted outer membrane repeat protein